MQKRSFRFKINVDINDDARLQFIFDRITHILSVTLLFLKQVSLKFVVLDRCKQVTKETMYFKVKHKVWVVRQDKIF